ncbi:Aminomethyltransferase [invertebrate metagenome]|uniref:aminomethyltransferase n=1 Tax=invertebrate metagenome TaxID=1711999 RepID=A0A2H9T468_9ZZZZ
MCTQPELLQQTPLYSLHLQLNATMSSFAGYDMPIRYPEGIKQEHLHTRSSASLFDVSHMGQCTIRGNLASEALEALMPQDIIGLKPGRQRYGLLTNEKGGIQDDLMITRFSGEEDKLLLVVNAACKQQDFSHIQAHLPASVTMDIIEDRALIALQGPKAAQCLERLEPDVASMIFMDMRVLELTGAACFVSRSGYTGEDGFEISVPNSHAKQLVEALLDMTEVKMAGLGARDSLRLEAGLCLYGNDISQTTTPVEASLSWSINKARKTGQIRAGGFPGSRIILEQLNGSFLKQKRIGLRGATRTPVRQGTLLFNQQRENIGTVTSGTFSPSLSMPVAMGYIKPEYADINTLVFADVRGKLVPLTVLSMPFVKANYYRG